MPPEPTNTSMVSRRERFERRREESMVWLGTIGLVCFFAKPSHDGAAFVCVFILCHDWVDHQKLRDGTKEVFGDQCSEVLLESLVMHLQSAPIRRSTMDTSD
mmetsp:Transcript_33476/g.66655  ORF Transcript_33476/g.66655 Transcript_33476/m.66655 type:complete len:102 (+) Transcript_33476:683-988(+)